MKRSRVERNRLKMLVWDMWCSRFPIEVISTRAEIEPAEVVRFVEEAIKDRMRMFKAVPSSQVRLETLLAQIDRLENYLWMHLSFYQTQWADAMRENDEQRVQYYADLVKTFAGLLQSLLMHKAEVWRRFGVVPSEPEKSAHLIGIVSPSRSAEAVLENLSAIVGRTPVKLSETNTQAIVPSALPADPENLTLSTNNE